jgi:hypothetical protein
MIFSETYNEAITADEFDFQVRMGEREWNNCCVHVPRQDFCKQGEWIIVHRADRTGWKNLPVERAEIPKYFRVCHGSRSEAGNMNVAALDGY